MFIKHYNNLVNYCARRAQYTSIGTRSGRRCRLRDFQLYMRETTRSLSPIVACSADCDYVYRRHKIHAVNRPRRVTNLQLPLQGGIRLCTELPLLLLMIISTTATTTRKQVVLVV